MSAESKRTLIAVGRKVVFAGLVLLMVWLMLFALRGTISAGIINQINAEMRMESQTGQTVSLNPWSWDWSRSLWSGKPVAGIVGERMGATLGLIGVTAVFSLLLALFFLFVGMLISRATSRPPWLAKMRGVLRLLVVSLAVATPIFAVETLVVVYPSVWWGVPQEGPENSPLVLVIAAFTASALPAWLLVQYGHGELSEWPAGTIADGRLWRHLAITMLSRVLRLSGAIVVMGMFVVMITSLSGIGRLFVDAINRRDFPIVFGIVWALAAIVVLAKLIADLVEIASKSNRSAVRTPVAPTPQPRRFMLPKWVPVVCLALVAVSLGVALAAPAIAPYDQNEMIINARLQPPSSQHILGTDNLGRDVFSRLVFGIRQDIFLGLIAAGIALAVTAGWAVLAARVRRTGDWRGDTFEDLVMLPRDALYSVPWLVLLLFMMSLVGPPSSGPFTFLRYSLPVALFAGLVLVPRAAGMMQEAYHSPPDGRPWLKTVLTSIPVTLLFAVAGAIIYISAASYLGFGVFPPGPELGGMISGPARRYMLQEPWMALWPPAVLILLVTAWVMSGEVLLERLGFKSKAMWAKIWE